MLFGKDKLYHILVCAFITVATFSSLAMALAFYHKACTTRNKEGDEPNIGGGGGDIGDIDEADVEMSQSSDNAQKSSCLCNKFCRQCPKQNFILAAMSGAVSMLIGVAKEVGDLYNFWSICQPAGCQSSLADILADIIGVAAGEVLIFSALWANFRYGDG